MAQPPGPGAPPQAAPAAMRARVQRLRTALIQDRLDEAAARLEIRASQEPAWNGFSAAVKAVFAAPVAGNPPAATAPAPPADAAALLHRRAAAELARAQSLMRLADATTRLQGALDPNQREVLDQIVRTQLIRRNGRNGRPGGIRFGMNGRAGQVFRMRAPPPGGPPGGRALAGRQLGFPGPADGPDRVPPDPGAGPP